MSKLTVFNFISLDGYFEGLNHDISWHKHDKEDSEFALTNLKAGNTLLFGRLTYQLMAGAGYWPTEHAQKNDSTLATLMNNASKVVFSKTLKKAEWKNTRLVNDNMAEEVMRWKQLSGKNMTILGSGTIVTQLADEGLIDEYQLLINPVAMGAGTSLFKNIKQKLNLKLISTRTFSNGNVLLCYSL